MKALTAAEMRTVDRSTTERCGISPLQLMENAGKGVLQALQKEFFHLEQKRISILCGKGSNGGDGFVIARQLRGLGIDPKVYLFAPRKAVDGAAAMNLTRWIEVGGSVSEITHQEEWATCRDNALSADVIIDALLGTGLTGPVQEPIATAILDLGHQTRRFTVVAVDTPSGLPSDGEAAMGPFVFADITITFTAPKVGQLVSQDAVAVGKLVICSIGSPPQLVEESGKQLVRWLEPSEFKGLRLKRHPDANKGNFGHSLIVAGSRGKPGAAALAGEAALRSGAGLVTVASVDSVSAAIASYLPDLMTESLVSTDTGSISCRTLEYGRFDEISKGKTAMAIGPGLSTVADTQQFIRTAVSDCTLPIILDADGLNAFVSDPMCLRNRRSSSLTVTPHPGEMARLLGVPVGDVQGSRLRIATEAAAAWNAVVILKGYHTVLADSNGIVFVNTTGTPGMAKGGTGDVLTGILTGLTSQLGTGDWLKTLGFGVYVHGLAGEIAARRKGVTSMLASDLLNCLPEAICQSCEEIANA